MYHKVVGGKSCMIEQSRWKEIFIMKNLEGKVRSYLEYCEMQKRLDGKTLKAYRIDLRKFLEEIVDAEITVDLLEEYISKLHEKFKPKTVKRKIASLKAFFHYLEYKEMIDRNPFNKIQLHFREPVILPKTIPLGIIEKFLGTIYGEIDNARTVYQKRNALRDVAVVELLFATGMRISELCTLKNSDVDLENGVVLIYGKGSKERRLQIGNQEVIAVLKRYKNDFRDEIGRCGHFFVNQSSKVLSDQAVRRMINKYTVMAAIELHITPHMFRHTFATALLEADVDIRYIQEMLGHSSIMITEIYTHVATSKQRDILATKHPRKNFKI